MSSNPPSDPQADLVTLRARRVGGAWHVALTRDPAPALTEADRARSEAIINAAMAQQEARLAALPLAWRQELPITTYREGATAFAMGEEFAARLAANEASEGAYSGLPVEMSQFVVETALERQGQAVAGRWRRRLGLRLMAWGATFAALVWLALSLLLSLRWPRLRSGLPRTVIALHAEAANRTRHVRKALAGRSPADTAVMFVGRLHVGAAQARAILAEAGWNHGFALAWDWRAILAGVPRGLALARHAAPAIAAAGYRPTFAQLTAMVFRVLLGTASAWRWERAGNGVETVVFGHVGRADTILQEAVMQAGGANTVHWMHGVSVGRAYQGVSDICATLCAHDVGWHERLLNYRRNVHFALPKPALRAGTRPGWAVLTNMTHYGYTYFPSIGPAHELRLIEIVAELARRDGVAPDQVVWKPHPVFYQRDPAVRELVSARLAGEGFTLWPDEIMPFDLSASYETVIVTPSGVALDLLKAGRLPVMAEFQPIDQEHVLAHIEPRGRDRDSLAHAIATARDPGLAEALFEQVWQRTGPGAIGSIEDIERAVRGLVPLPR